MHTMQTTRATRAMRAMRKIAPIIVAAIATAIITIAAPRARAQQDAPLRIGLLGLDSSHAVAFTELINDASRPDHVPGARVVAAYKGGSPGLAISDTRIEKFTADVTGKLNIPLVDTIDALLTRVDAVLLLSVDARQHLAQAKPVLAAHKRVFIDKPIAASYGDARAIAEVARSSGTPFFSSSSLRYSPHIQRLREKASGVAVRGAFTWGPAPTESYLPDLFWYGIHSIESLYALMGPGCESVTRTYTPSADLVSCRWRDGRIGTIRGTRDEDHAYGATVFGSDAAFTETSRQTDYHGLVVEIMKFFKTGVPPIAPGETLELVAFMEAADVSKSRNGAPVPLTEITTNR
jgi:predicted dehydrogenase